MVINITHFGVLMQYASELGKAKKSGDVERIRIAQQNHDEYKELCMKSDQMVLGNASVLTYEKGERND